MNKHTPGPWEIDDCGNIIGQGAALAMIYGAEDFPCLPEEKFDETAVECAANARLMAASPELLAELEALHAILIPFAYYQNSDRFNRVAALIAKAKGV